MTNKKDLIRSANLFKEFSEHEIEKLAYKSEVVTCAKNNIIYMTGDQDNFIYLIISGWIKAYTTSLNGQETIIAVIGQGSTFGDTASLGNTSSLVSTQAITPVKLLKIPKTEFAEVLKSNSNALDLMFKMSAKRVNYLIGEVEQLVTCNANERIGLFLLKMMQHEDITFYEHDDCVTIKLPYAKSIVASQLGMQAETFSRAFSKLKKEKVISSSQRNITINSISKLRSMCTETQEFKCYHLM